MQLFIGYLRLRESDKLWTTYVNFLRELLTPLSIVFWLDYVFCLLGGILCRRRRGLLIFVFFLQIIFADVARACVSAHFLPRKDVLDGELTQQFLLEGTDALAVHQLQDVYDFLGNIRYL